ncbi:MAG: hypothetical protein F4Y87_01150 [Synechococcus sp. SB0665_bin_28]|nr:hypothetical protein [Synechococcus sp. SB0667_bin_8]MXY62058.1 hypothetical protein [Synechococcus sp. SB0665_bin_28]MYF19487.1 hypothetical protein [Synechococcus sp. SB0677_bin_5]
MVVIGCWLVSAKRGEKARRRRREWWEFTRKEAAVTRAVTREDRATAISREWWEFSRKEEEAEAGREKEEVRKRKEESREWEERRREPVDPHQHRRRRDGTVVKGRTRRPKRSLERRPRKRTERGRK